LLRILFYLVKINFENDKKDYLKSYTYNFKLLSNSLTSIYFILRKEGYDEI